MRSFFQTRSLARVPPHGWLALITFPFAFGLVVCLSVGPSVNSTDSSVLPNFLSLLSQPYGGAFVASFLIGIAVAVTTTITSCAVAWHVRFAIRRSWRIPTLIILSIPIVGSHYLRISALGMLLTPNSPIPILVDCYSQFTSVLGLLSWTLPLGALISFAGLARVPDKVILAAKNHGSSTSHLLAVLVLPQMNIELGITFIYALGFALTDGYCNQILNSNRGYLLSGVIADRLRISDWPLVSAVAVIILLIEAGLIAIATSAVSFKSIVRSRRWAC
jgi:ABC-type spermidine/putrescine transport system permease subunit I